MKPTLFAFAFLLFILVFFLANTPVFAGPIFITRGLLIHRLYEPTVADSGGFLTRTSMWGGVQKGFGSEGERFGWLLDVGAVIELGQWKSSSLFGISGMQINADPYNEISFNPTGVTWEEHVVYVAKAEPFDWQIGYAQRCRHDVDNLDIKQTSGEAQQRTLIYSSLTGKLISKEHSLSQQTNMIGWLNADLYVVSQDYRLPDTTSHYLPNIERLAWSLGANVHVGSTSSSLVGWYANAAATLSAYGNEHGILRKFSTIERTNFDFRAEAGISILGRGGKFWLFGGYELLADDAIMPIPEKNSHMFVGFRFSGKDLIY